MPHRESSFSVTDGFRMSQSLLSSLEDRQKACRLYIDRISDILSAQLPNVFIYKASSTLAVFISANPCIKEYCMQQGQAISRLQTLRDQDPKLATYLQVSSVHISLSRSRPNLFSESRPSGTKMPLSGTSIFLVSCWSLVRVLQTSACTRTEDSRQCNASRAIRY
jgi:hypothetical protein